MPGQTMVAGDDHEPVVPSVTFSANTISATAAAATITASTAQAAEALKLFGERVKELEDRAADLKSRTFESEIRRLAQDRPGMSLAAAIDLIDRGDSLVGLGGATVRERAEWVLSQPDIVDFMENEKKINAIKEVRARTHMGLKEAKDAVEYAADLKKRGWLSPAEQEKLEAEAREAIASIQAALRSDDV